MKLTEIATIESLEKLDSKVEAYIPIAKELWNIIENENRGFKNFETLSKDEELQIYFKDLVGKLSDRRFLCLLVASTKCKLSHLLGYYDYMFQRAIEIRNSNNELFEEIRVEIRNLPKYL